VSIAHAAVTDLLHTDTDPQSIGDEIPYSTTVVSVGVARRVDAHFVAGAALRWHTGNVEGQRGSVLATDAGVVLDHLTGQDVRLAASTFLATFRLDDSPVLAFAGDVRVAGADSSRAVRAGMAYQRTRNADTELYPYLEGRFMSVTARGGLVRVDEFSSATWHMRFAVALQHDGYTLSLVREENEGGLNPTYQIAVTSVFR
jgi:hypothetical protein